MVDARGLLCPMPVVMVNKELKANSPDTLDVLVDDPCAVENVTRLAAMDEDVEAVYEKISNEEYTLLMAAQ